MGRIIIALITIGIVLLSTANKAYSYNDKSGLTQFVQNIKALRLNEDTCDEVSKKIGTPNMKLKEKGCDTWLYQYGIGDAVFARVYFEKNGILYKIKVYKTSASGSEDIYVKGGEENRTPVTITTAVDHITLINNPPVAPTPGQIYFNSTDSHFYGYNGKEWLQLDNPKN